MYSTAAGGGVGIARMSLVSGPLEGSHGCSQYSLLLPGLFVHLSRLENTKGRSQQREIKDVGATKTKTLVYYGMLTTDIPS